MISRLLFVLVAVAALGGAIAYSKIHHEPGHVSGIVEADEIRVGSRVGGRVQAVRVKEGQAVQLGEVLVELEPFDLLQREQEALKQLAIRDAELRSFVAGLRPAEVAQAKARHEQSKARLDLLEAGPRKQEIEAARGRLQAADAELTLARRNHTRSAELFQDKAIARAEFDAANEQLNASEAMLLVRKEELALLEAGTRSEEIREAQARVDEAYEAWQLAASGYRAEDIERAKAARDAAEAALAVIREQKRELTIVAPCDGVVEALDLQVGDLAPMGAPALSIMDTSHLWVRAYVPQNRVGLQIGQPLAVTADSLDGGRLRGEVSFISRQAEFTPSNVQTSEEREKQVFRIKVALPGDEPRLRPGMTVDVWLDPVEEQP
ncbi:MAG: efflux RND transporter periplasmic adaptor subunit [Planctomycetales bacterium]|nr:efflux RND transporter periplasmic adaptor subunit [Planctomycetales bacterium]